MFVLGAAWIGFVFARAAGPMSIDVDAREDPSPQHVPVADKRRGPIGVELSHASHLVVDVVFDPRPADELGRLLEADLREPVLLGRRVAMGGVGSGEHYLRGGPWGLWGCGRRVDAAREGDRTGPVCVRPQTVPAARDKGVPAAGVVVARVGGDHRAEVGQMAADAAVVLGHHRARRQARAGRDRVGDRGTEGQAEMYGHSLPVGTLLTTGPGWKSQAE
ncbi:hypothetical protein PtA15_10A159 [Puccinia triticina]|uniref:Uncharacterized protein n=1 Tax=Puccinia triticina TaxID=208348 RepID=A0ABY7CVQ5_9BASI|nr:uncharacterized protein PtA15_10A159 [Puccinia triticina]WAQ88740.1 hypothetical protein PtA15_10A159 [Puccinia triticina]